MAITQEIIASLLPFASLLLINPSNQNLPQKALQNLPKDNVWVVKESDTLTSIARDYYGKEEAAVLLVKDNKIVKDPNVIEKGWLIKLRDKKIDKKEEKEIADSSLYFSFSSTDADVKAEPKEEKKEKEIATTPVSQTGSTFEQIYREAGQKYRIPWQILYGIHLTETGLRDGEIYNNQGSGAQGPMQFMPGTWRAYGADGNGDGINDINNAVDAIHGAANFLAKHGSVYNGLLAYGGNTAGTIAAAREKGLTNL